MISIRTKLYARFLFHALFSRNKLNSSTQQRVYIFLAADYGNLGDVAITQAQHLFLQAKYPTAEVIEVPISKTLACLRTIARIVKPEDIITLVGGGNMGDLYDDIEYIRQLVIREFPRHLIYSFPQSIYFSESELGKKRLTQAQQVYGKHSMLHLMARDPVSYTRMTAYFPHTHIKLCPDIVLSLDKRSDVVRNREVLLCLRKDKERAINDIWSNPTLTQYIQKNYERVQQIDTQISDEWVKKNGGKQYLDQLLDTFSRSGLIVTDRLHGMIFSFITQTPALVFDNTTRKVSSTYTWIRDCGFIHLVDEDTNFESLRFINNFEAVKKRLNSLFNQLL